MVKMKAVTVAILGLAVSVHASVQGFDISSYQPSVNFAGAKSSGAAFVIIKVINSTSKLGELVQLIPANRPPRELAIFRRSSHPSTLVRQRQV